jgi:hemerythrin
MAIIKWAEDYSVGVEEIDKQHKVLVQMLNDLFDAMSVGKANDVLGVIINKMVGYAQLHFSTEEKYFDAFNYEFSQEHKDEHQRFTDDVASFKKGFDSGNIVLSMEVFRFLKDWLTRHILGSDQKYVKCFKENGLS